MADKALIIGINNHQRLKPLQYAQADAAAFGNYCQNEAIFAEIFYTKGGLTLTFKREGTA